MSEKYLQTLLNEGFRYAFALCQNQHMAEDLVQMAWLGILKIQAPRNKAYLFRAIRNHFINNNKRHQLVPMVSIDTIAELDRHDIVEDYSNLLIDLRDLEQFLGQLRSIEREFLFLHCHQGLTHQEIADLTNTPRNTVLSLIRRAIQKLNNLAGSSLEAEV